MTKVAVVAMWLLQRRTPTPEPIINPVHSLSEWFDRLSGNPVFWVIVVVALAGLVFKLWRLGGGKYDKEI